MADPRTGRAIMARAIESLRRSWRSLAATDLAYKAIAFALLSPATALLLRWIRASGAGEVVADTDILWFFVTNPAGVATLIVGLSLIVAITGLEAACLMAIGVEAAQGRHLDARSALAFGASNGPKVLALTARMAVRVLAALLPFLLAAGAVYWTLLREHDINYYLSQRPPQFFAALVVVGVMVIAAAFLLARTVARWALALPLVLFEEVISAAGAGRERQAFLRRPSADRQGRVSVGPRSARAVECHGHVARARRSRRGAAARRLARAPDRGPPGAGSGRRRHRSRRGDRQLFPVRAVDRRPLPRGRRAQASPAGHRQPFERAASALRARARRGGGGGRARGSRGRTARAPRRSRRPAGDGDRASRLVGGRSREHAGGVPAGRR